MKTKIKQLSLVILLLISKIYGQEEGNITGKFYISNVDIVVQEFDYENKQAKPNKFIAKKGTKFTAQDLYEKNIVIKFWVYDSPNSVNPQKDEDQSYHYISNSTNGKYFLIELDDLNKKTSSYNGRNNSFIWGFSTLPIKLRFGAKDRSFQYQTGFSLGVNAGWERQFSSRYKQSIALVFGIGISTVNLNPEDVNNYLDKPTSSGAFTPSLGGIYSFESFQIGLFSGFDIIAGEVGKNWAYKNSPWLGLGLGFTIFQKNKTGNSDKQSQ